MNNLLVLGQYFDLFVTVFDWMPSQKKNCSDLYGFAFII